MPLMLDRCRVPLLLAAAMLLGTARAEGQVGIGFGLSGYPFLYYNPQYVPSPTQYLFDRSIAQAESYSNAVAQDARDRQMRSGRDDPNAYYNKTRDFSGQSLYDIDTRRSLSDRTSATPPRSTARTSALTSQPIAPPSAPALATYLRSDHTFDWPFDPPASADLDRLRKTADAAVLRVIEQSNSGQPASVQSVVDAKTKLIAYGQQALQQVRAGRSRPVADLFHTYLLVLLQSVERAAQPRPPAS